MPQVLYQVGHPGGDAALVNDARLMMEAVLECFEREPGMPVVIFRQEVSDEAFAEMLQACGEMVDAGDAHMTARVIDEDEE